MRIKAQVAMVMNLDKCIGCHTCSVTCKNTWTNRPGAEYMWWNNVETKPGLGYPRRWEDQATYKGGWQLKDGRLELASGSPARRLLRIFHNPDLPTVDEYYEPWTYDYHELLASPSRSGPPTARPRSLLDGRALDAPSWGPNWEDDLAGAPEHAPSDPDLQGLEHEVLLRYQEAFFFYLPRICEHCLNPACVAACPSGAMYKRDEDGIVLVDQEACRGWRFCVSACPYKKVYFNWQTHKAEKCTFCYPRLEAGLPTVCSETCVGRIRYLGVLLYDADEVPRAAAEPEVKNLLQAQFRLFLDPHDPEVAAAAREQGIPEPWLDAARRSPVYRLAVEWRVALPLHPEFRTLPMVWYVPPLSPLLPVAAQDTPDDERESLLKEVERLRIPVAYLANLLAAGDTEVVRRVLIKLVALRHHMRALSLGTVPDPAVAEQAGLSPEALVDMARLFAVAKFEERFVVPTGRRGEGEDLAAAQGGLGLGALVPGSFCRGCAGHGDGGS